VSNDRHVPRGREPGPDLTKAATDAVMAAEMALPVDPSPVTPRTDHRPIYDVASRLQQRPPAGVKRPVLDVGLKRRTQGSDPRALGGGSS
jgi:hypothetical protein